MSEFGILINSYDGLYEAAAMDATTKYEGRQFLGQMAGVSATYTITDETIRASTHAVFVTAAFGNTPILPNVYLYDDPGSGDCFLVVTSLVDPGPETANYIYCTFLRLI